MRNLKVFQSISRNLKLNIGQITHFAIDSLTPLTFFASNDVIIVLNDDYSEVDRIDLSQFRNTHDDHSMIVSVDYLSDQLLLCCCLQNGQIFTYEPLSGSVESVGCVSNGICACCWSPDLGLLVLVSAVNSVLLMTAEFDVVSEFDLHPDGFGQDQLVTVGWGKKETQFQGSAGKQAAFVKPEDPTPVFPWDEGLVSVVWRGDGQFFAVSSVSTENNCRVIRIWTRDGIHSSTCDWASGVEQGLAWKPSGSVIATSAHRQNDHQIIFYERNGQRHYEFSLRFTEKSRNVLKLCWNLDSTILAVWSRSLSDNENDYDKVQLWICNNYHWYLKYSLKYDLQHKLALIIWDLEQANILHLVTTNGHHRKITFAFSTDLSQYDLSATIAVIDGVELKLTPFAKAVVPPPMSLYSTKTIHPMVQLAWSMKSEIAVLLDDFETICLAHVTNGECSDWVVLKCDEDTEFSIDSHNFKWLNDTLFFLVTSYNYSTIFTLSLMKDIKKWTKSSEYIVDFQISSIFKHPRDNVLLIQCSKGAWWSFQVDGTSTSIPAEWLDINGLQVKFKTVCSDVQVVSVSDRIVLIGLSNGYQLFVDNQQIATNVNSFVLHDRFLLVTTLAHQIFCIPLEKLLEAELKLSEFGNGRSLERGSRLVCAVPNATRVVMQMPRGNLETIDPRPLTLLVIRQLIDNLRYKEAIKLMKRHRINMNLLYDHNPKAFMTNVKEFIEQISDPLLLNLFLMELISENTLVTMYSEAYGNLENADASIKNGPDKVDIICAKVREALESFPNLKCSCFTVLLSTYIKLSKPQIDSALQRVKEILDTNNEPLVDEALRHLLYVVDADTLFNMALTTYDFDLVLLVAQRSQKDPKEYLPFLNELRRMESNYMKFKIQVHLERYEKALEHLAKCGAERTSECLEFVKKRHLYKQAITIFEGTDSHKLFCSAYGHHLHSKRLFQEAAVFYFKADDDQWALESYLSDLDWRRVIYLSQKMKKSSEQLNEILEKVAIKLIDRQRFSEAAIVYERYLQKPEQAIASYCDASDWLGASLVFCADIVSRDAKIVHSLKKRLSDLINLMDGYRKDLDTYTTRLQIVREIKKDRLSHWIEMGEPDFPKSEVYSEASSIVSRSSAVTSKTARAASRKERRKIHEKKKLSTKEGGRYEDLALLNSIKEIIKQSDAMREEIGVLLLALVQFNLSIVAVDLQHRFGNLLTHCSRISNEVWPKLWSAHQLPGPLEDIFKDDDGEVRLPSDGSMPAAIQLEPQMHVPLLRKEIQWELDSLK